MRPLKIWNPEPLFPKLPVIPGPCIYTSCFSFCDLCLGNGWFLDEVVIKDPTVNHEYTFFCHRFVDVLCIEQIGFILVLSSCILEKWMAYSIIPGH